MPPWKTDTDRALWVLADTCLLRIPERTDGRTMRLIGDLFCFQTKYNEANKSFWKQKRIIVGRYNENGDFVTLHTLKRKEAIEFVKVYKKELT